jgi:hypothetical protein
MNDRADWRYSLGIDPLSCLGHLRAPRELPGKAATLFTRNTLRSARG